MQNGTSHLKDCWLAWHSLHLVSCQQRFHFSTSDQLTIRGLILGQARIQFVCFVPKWGFCEESLLSGGTMPKDSACFHNQLCSACIKQISFPFLLCYCLFVCAPFVEQIPLCIMVICVEVPSYLDKSHLKKMFF